MTDNADPSGSKTTTDLIIVIVGPCASGKTTLAANLSALGFDARVIGQEHSEIHSLWAKPEPDVVIALHIDLETLRIRRGPTWSKRLFDAQHHRLRDAYAAADLHLDTSILDEEEVVRQVVDLILEAVKEKD